MNICKWDQSGNHLKNKKVVDKIYKILAMYQLQVTLFPGPDYKEFKQKSVFDFDTRTTFNRSGKCLTFNK